MYIINLCNSALDRNREMKWGGTAEQSKHQKCVEFTDELQCVFKRLFTKPQAFRSIHLRLQGIQLQHWEK